MVGAMALALWMYVRRRRRVAELLGDPPLVRRLVGEDLRRVPWARVAAMLVATALLGLAATDPRSGEGAGDGGASAVALVLDVSNSMLVSDVAPSRLAQERLAAEELIRALEGSRVGMVIFAGRAYVLSPLTGDPGALQLFVDALDPSIVEQTGSSLSAAIRQAAGLLAPADRREMAETIVLISDGDAFEPPAEILGAAEQAAAAGITVHTVGIGTERGGRVPEVDPETDRQTGFKTDPLTGEVAISRARPELLRQIARAAGGEFFDLSSPGAIARLTDRLATGGADGERFPLYPWLITFALALLVWDALRDGKRGQRRGNRGQGTGDTEQGVGRRVVTFALPHSRTPALPHWHSALRTLSGAVWLGLFACTSPAAEGNRAYRSGDYAAAAAAYREALDAERSPALLYNYGTALLALERYDEAREILQLAARAADGPTAEAAFYNAGNTDLEPVFRRLPGGERSAQLRRAIETYKRALLLDPDRLDSKWNLELAQRLLEEEQRAGGGGGGDTPQGGGGGRGDEEPRPGEAAPQPGPASGGPDPGPLSLSAAQELLARAERQELDAQRATLRKQSTARLGVRSW